MYPAKAGDKEFPGEFTDGETPDPFPNSEAKLVRPMVVALRVRVGIARNYEAGQIIDRPLLF